MLTGQAGQRLPVGTLGSAVQKAQQALGERGEKLKTAEEKTINLMHKAQKFADSTHKVINVFEGLLLLS